MQLNVRGMLSVLLCVVMLRPPIPAEAASAAVLGSISSYGAVAVGTVSAPAESIIFAGDLVSTRDGSAVIQYKQGARVLLGIDTEAQFTAGAVQLQKGQMSFRSGAEKGMAFSASSLRLEPASASSSAIVILDNGRATVSVTEGAVRVVDPTGVRLADIPAGEARLFAMAAPPAAAPAAAAPQVRAGGAAVASVAAIWALALGAVGFVSTVVISKVGFDEGDVLSSVSP